MQHAATAASNAPPAQRAASQGMLKAALTVCEPVGLAARAPNQLAKLSVLNEWQQTQPSSYIPEFNRTAAKKQRQKPLNVQQQQQQQLPQQQQQQHPEQVWVHQQQSNTELLQCIARCQHWRQLLPLSAQLDSLAHPPVLAAVFLSAVQLGPRSQHSIIQASSNGLTGYRAVDAGALLQAFGVGGTAAAAAAIPVAASGLLSVNQHFHDNLQYCRFLQHLISLVLATIARGTADSNPGGAATSKVSCFTAQQLSLVLMQLSSCRAHMQQQQQQQLQELLEARVIKPLIKGRPQDLLSVVAAMACFKPPLQPVSTKLQQRVLAVLSSVNHNQQQLQTQLEHGCTASDGQQWDQQQQDHHHQQQDHHQQQQQHHHHQHQQHQQQHQQQTSHSMKVQQLAVVLCTAGRLQWAADQHWVQVTAAAVVQQLADCTAADLAMALWGMAKLNCNLQLLQQTVQRKQHKHLQGQRTPQQPQRPLATAREQLLAAVAQHAAAFTAHELRSVLWAITALQLQPQRLLVQQLVRQCQQPTTLQQYTDIDLASIFCSLSAIQYQGPWRELQLQQLRRRRWQKPASNVSRTRRQWRRQQWQAAATASNIEDQGGDHLLVSLQLVEDLLQTLLVQLPASHAYYLSRAVHAVAVLGLKPAEPWVSRVLYHIQTNMPRMDMQSSALVISAVAALNFLPAPAWLGSFYSATQVLLEEAAALQKPPQQQQQQFLTDAAALAGPGDQGGADSHMKYTVLVAAVHRVGKSRNQHFKGQKPPGAWLNALSSVSLQFLGRLTPHQLATWGSAMRWFASLAGEPWPGPGRDWWAGFISCSEPLLAAAEPCDLRDLGFVVTRQRQHGPPPDSWVQAFMAATRSHLAPRGNGKDAAGAVVGSGAAQAQSSGVLQRHGTLSAAAAASAAGRRQSKAASAADLIGYAAALTRLKVLPDEAWLEQWLLAVEAADAQMDASLSKAALKTQNDFKTLQSIQVEADDRLNQLHT